MKPRGKYWSTAGFAVGIAASVGANVADTYVPPEHVAANWHPQVGAVISGMFWPIALLIAVEVLARVEWPHGRWWATLRFGGVATVALIAATISYRHLSALLVYYQEDWWTATVGPASIDGLMLTCTAALLAIGRAQRPQALEPVLQAPVTPQEPEPAQDTRPELNGHQRPLQQDQSVAELATVEQLRPSSAVRRQREAQTAYLASVASGKPLTYQELAKKFKMSERWSRLMIQQAKQVS